MPKCPKCKKVIEWLRYYETCKERGGFLINEHNIEEYESHTHPCAGIIDIYFYCPECDEKLFEDSIDAAEFLKRSDEVQQKLIGGEKLG